MAAEPHFVNTGLLKHSLLVHVAAFTLRWQNRVTTAEPR